LTINNEEKYLENEVNANNTKNTRNAKNTIVINFVKGASHTGSVSHTGSRSTTGRGKISRLANLKISKCGGLEDSEENGGFRKGKGEGFDGKRV